MNGPPRTPPKLPTPPKWMLYTIILAVVVSWIPLALIARSRAIRSPEPRVHLFLDMDNQPRYEAQSEHPLYADRRAMRPPVPGAVPRTPGEERGVGPGDDHFRLGYETNASGEPVMATRTVNGNETQTVNWYTDYPEQVEVDRELLERGRERYNIYCAVCHGRAGYGDGMVARRAAALDPANTPGWVAPVNLHSVNPNTGGLLYGGPDYATGRLLNVITNGIRTMPGYGKQIPVEDRWAIVAYVKALQFSQHVPAEQVPQDLRGQLRPPEPPEDEGEAGGAQAQQPGTARQGGAAPAQPGPGAAPPQPQQPQPTQPPTPNRGD